MIRAVTIWLGRGQPCATHKRGQLAIILWLLCSAAILCGQNSVSSLRGSVTDPTGAPVAGVQVELQNKQTGFANSRLTNSHGEYQFQQIPAGDYTIAVAGKGFARELKRAELLVNQPATVNFALSVQSVDTVVEVSAEAVILNLVDASMGDAVNNRTIQALPMEGRNVPELLSLQPGVVYLGSGIDQTHDSRSGAPAAAAPTRATSPWMAWTTTTR